MKWEKGPPRVPGIATREPAHRTKSADELIVFVLGHPIRVDALQILNEREASVSEIARELREDAKKVGNHVKALFESGCIEHVRSAKKRGAEEHFYRGSLHPEVSEEEWRRMTPETRQWISALVLQGILAEALSAFRAGTFDSRLDRPLSCTKMSLDEQGWAELAQSVDDLTVRMAEIRAAASRRLDERAEKGVPVIAAAFAIERALPSRGSLFSV